MSGFKINILYKNQFHFYKLETNRKCNFKKTSFIITNTIDYFGIN